MMTEESIVRQNMMDDESYRGYCGNNSCRTTPRTKRLENLQQKCPDCGWESKFPESFLKRYKEKHKL